MFSLFRRILLPLSHILSLHAHFSEEMTEPASDDLELCPNGEDDMGVREDLRINIEDRLEEPVHAVNWNPSRTVMVESETRNGMLQSRVENRVDASVPAQNGNLSRRGLLQVGFMTMAVSGTLICDFSVRHLLVRPLAGLYIFAVYSSLFMGLLLLAAALTRWTISDSMVKKTVWISVFLVHIELALKAGHLILSKK